MRCIKNLSLLRFCTAVDVLCVYICHTSNTPALFFRHRISPSREISMEHPPWRKLIIRAGWILQTCSWLDRSLGGLGGRPPPNPTEVRGKTPINRLWISACGKLFYKSQLASGSLMPTAPTSRTCCNIKPFCTSIFLGLLGGIRWPC